MKEDDQDLVYVGKIVYPSGQTKVLFGYIPDESGTKTIRHGNYVEYHENGNVRSHGWYENGKEEGLWRDYFEDGKLAAEGYYSGGKEVGTWKFWSSDGTRDPDEFMGVQEHDGHKPRN